MGTSLQNPTDGGKSQGICVSGGYGGSGAKTCHFQTMASFSLLVLGSLALLQGRQEHRVEERS